MTLRELLARRRDRSAAGRSGARRCADRGTCVPQRGRHAGDALFLRAGLRGRRARVRARRGRAAERPRWCASGRSGTDVPEVVVPSVRAAMGPLAAAFHGQPDGAAARGRRDRHERQDHDRLPRASRARGGRASGRACSARSHSVVGGRVEEVERTTPEAVDLQATFARMLDGGRPGVRDGGVLARARPAPRGRDRVRLRGVHEPDAGPPRLPRHAGRLLRGQAKLFLPAVGRAAGGRGR